MSRIAAALVLTTASPLLLPNAAAQFGLYNLPQNDFTWYWGSSSPEKPGRGPAEIEVNGSEGGFQCELKAKTRTLSLTPDQIREVEYALQSRLDFIYAVNETMYNMDQARQIDWAVLDCKKYQEEERTQEESAQREAEAREKMMRELERRRAKQNK